MISHNFIAYRINITYYYCFLRSFIGLEAEEEPAGQAVSASAGFFTSLALLGSGSTW